MERTPTKVNDSEDFLASPAVTHRRLISDLPSKVINTPQRSSGASSIAGTPRRMHETPQTTSRMQCAFTIVPDGGSTPDTAKVHRRLNILHSSNKSQHSRRQAGPLTVEVNDVDKEQFSSDFGRRKLQFDPAKIVSPREPFKFQEKAIPLLSVVGQAENDPHFQVNPDAVSMLQQIKGPIAVISVAGMYRTGKSYLLNRLLLNQKGGFKVGPTVNSCTKGIWIWGTPIQKHTEQGESYNLLILDSEGIGGLDEDNNHDMRIFTLALLLSSYFIYNSMTQIDETALQSLSLVVNLSKHVQTQNTETQHDPEEDLDQYLPKFLWVVRDFALQLEDAQGNPISDRDYLELALQQKGSNAQERTNQIRAALLRFFKDRDCSTMIRPLLNEDKLQMLEEIEINQLRSEFVEQVCNLRKKVFERIPLKRIRAQAMDGQQWIGLVQMYCDAFNLGKVPAIQDSWHHICASKCEQVQKQLMTEFDELLAQLPTPWHCFDLQSQLETLQTNQLATLHQACKSQISDEIYQGARKQMTNEMSRKAQTFMESNQIKCQELATEVLNKCLAEIDGLKQMNEDPELADQIDYALKYLYDTYIQDTFDFPEKHLMLAEEICNFLQSFIRQHLQFQKHQQHQRGLLDDQTRQMFEDSLQQHKQKWIQQRTQLEQDLQQSKLARTELNSQLESLQEQLAQKDQQLQQTSERDHSCISHLKDQNQILQQEILKRQEEIEDLERDFQRREQQQQSEMQKERALFQHKSEYLTEQIKQLQEAKDTSVDQATQRLKQVELQLRQAQQALESRAQTMQLSEMRYQEQLQDYEHMTEALNSQLSQLHTANSRLEQQVQELQSHSQLQALKMSPKKRPSVDLTSKEQSLLKQKEDALQQLETEKQAIQSQLQQALHAQKKQEAMNRQRLEFLELQLKESQSALSDSQRQHQKLIEMLHEQAAQPTEDSKEEPGAEISSEEADRLRARLVELEEQLKSAESEHRQEVQRIHQKYKDQRDKQQSQLSTAQQALQAKLLQSQTDFAALKQEYNQLLEASQSHKEVDDLLSHHQQEIRDLVSEHEHQLVQMKQLQEIEIQKQTMLLNEEKERSSRQYNRQQSDFDQQLHQERESFQHDIEQLTDRLREQEHEAHTLQQRLTETQQQLKSAQNDFASQVHDLKSKLQAQQSNSEHQFELALRKSEESRHALQSKVEELLQGQVTKEREFCRLEAELSSLRQVQQRHQQESAAQKDSQTQELAQMQAKVKELKGKLLESQDSQMTMRNEYERFKALLEQQSEFQQQKIADLNATLAKEQQNFEKKLSAASTEQDQVVTQSQKQIQHLQKLLDDKTAVFKRHQQDSHVQICQLTTERDHLLTQIEQLSRDHTNNQEQFQGEIQLMRQQLTESQNPHELSRLRDQLLQVEQQLFDSKADHDKDRALFENKCRFLEQQKEACKQDLLSWQRKFELTLEQLQKRKEMSDQETAAIAAQLDRKYQHRMAELLHQSNQTQEKLRSCQTELQMSQRDLENAQQLLQASENTLHQLQSQSSRLQINNRDLEEDFQRQISDREAQIRHLQSMLKEGKEQQKSNRVESDLAKRELEQKRSALFFQLEKERAQWLSEKEQSQRFIADLQDQIQTLERREQRMKMENERLRSRPDSSMGMNRKSVPKFTFNHTPIIQRQEKQDLGGQFTLIDNYTKLNQSVEQLSPQMQASPHQSPQRKEILRKKDFLLDLQSVHNQI